MGSIHRTERFFVSQIVAKESNGAGVLLITACLRQDSLDGAPFVAADAQLQARFKLELRKSLESGQRGEQCPRLPLNFFGRFGWNTAPVHHDCIGLVFKEATEAIEPKLLS